MIARRFHSLVVVLLAILSAAALGVTSTMQPAFISVLRTVTAAVALAENEALIMGGTGTPIPPPSYVDGVSNFFPNGYVGNHIPLFTPEGGSPIYTGVKSLPLDTSAAQGVQILDHAITTPPAEGGYAGNDLLVLGYSQSAIISSLEMEALANSANPPDPSALSFVLLGNLMNPNGGLMERFGDADLPPLSLPSLGFTFFGATPVDTPYSTDIFTLEYDGFADFPRYPLNLLADLNAVLGIATVHGKYPDLDYDSATNTFTDPTTGQTLNAILLDGSADLPGGSGATNYWMLPTDTLPLLAPLKAIPVIGQPLYDLLEPNMRILVNLGYGDPEFGWSTDPANVPTPFGLFPGMDDLMKAFTMMGPATQEGFNAFIHDLQNLSFSDLFPVSSAPADFTLPSLTDIVDAISSAASTAYSTLLPTADIVNALVTSVPMYAINLFTQFLGEGDLLSAIGMPIAATMGLGSIALGVELMMLEQAFSDIAADFSGLFS